MAQRIEERLDKLERTFDSTVSALADTTSDILLRQLGLQDALEQKGILSDPDVRARMQALSDYAELQLDLANPTPPKPTSSKLVIRSHPVGATTVTSWCFSPQNLNAPEGGT